MPATSQALISQGYKRVRDAGLRNDQSHFGGLMHLHSLVPEGVRITVRRAKTRQSLEKIISWTEIETCEFDILKTTLEDMLKEVFRG